MLYSNSAIHSINLSSIRSSNIYLSISSNQPLPNPSPPPNPTPLTPPQPLLLQRILRQPLQPIMPLPPHPLRLTRILPKRLPVRPSAAIARSRLPEIPSVRDVALDAAGPDVHFAGVAGVPVRGHGGVVGEGQVGLALGDYFGFGFGVLVDDGLGNG